MPESEPVINQLDNLMNDLRRRSEAEPANAAPLVSAAAASSSLAPQPAQAVKDAGQKSEEPEKTECDLDSPEEVVQYMKLFWPMDKADIDETLRFAVSTMKSQATRNESVLIHKEVIKKQNSLPGGWACHAFSVVG